MALDTDRIGGQRHAHGGDAGRPVFLGLVEHEAVTSVDFVNEVAERLLLKMAQQLGVAGLVSHG